MVAESRIEIQHVSHQFGGVAALTNLSLDLRGPSTIGLIGPNGSGKSTLLAIISGLLRPTSGRVQINGVDVTRTRANVVALHGVSRTFQQPRLVPTLRVWENIAIGVHGGQPKPKVQVLAERLGLTSVLDAWPAEIPAGVQRKVEVARALARNPQVLLMDEPAAGLGDGDIEELITVIRGVSSSVLTILVEHNMQLIGDVADEVVVLIEGVVAIRDSPDVVARAAAVRQAYLGVG